MSITTNNGLARRQAAPTPLKDAIPITLRPSQVVSRPPAQSILIWDEDRQAADNYRMLGDALAKSNDLYRRPGYASGLLLLLEDGKHAVIAKGTDLAPVIVDRVLVTVVKSGKPKGSRIAVAHLNAMLASETFLGQFRTVDQVTTTPAYLPDFELTRPGLNEGGGQRVLYVGDEPVVSNSTDAIRAFLEVMAFETEADRTNAVAGALTVLLRNHLPGGKPILIVTANKSHAGKDTVISFAAGVAGSVSISYQATNWALERSFVGALKNSPDVGVIVIENARLDRRDKFLASAFLERFATDPEPLLFSTGTGPSVRRPNDLVLAISTNFGSVSEDLMNRGLPVHLNLVGNVSDRVSPIGNPRLEYLPANRGRIAAELRGMVERWKSAGQPLDLDVRHPFSVWAGTIGGILRVNDFRDFLGNYGVRKTVDDPLRKGLGLLGAHDADQWLQASTWAMYASELGLIKAVIPPAEKDSEAGRARGIGVVLSAHQEETLQAETEDRRLTLRLEKRRGRFDGSDVQVRYRFVKVVEEDLPLDAEPRLLHDGKNLLDHLPQTSEESRLTFGDAFHEEEQQQEDQEPEPDSSNKEIYDVPQIGTVGTVKRVYEAQYHWHTFKLSPGDRLMVVPRNSKDAICYPEDRVWEWFEGKDYRNKGRHFRIPLDKLTVAVQVTCKPKTRHHRSAARQHQGTH
jgi:hypothetical protein